MIRLGLGLWAPSAPAAIVAVGTPLASSLTDDFNDNSRDATKWSVAGYDAVSAPTTGVTVAETNSRLEVTPPSGSGTEVYNGYLSVNTYDLTGSSIVVKISNIASVQSGEEPYISFGPDISNKYGIYFGGDSGPHFTMRKFVAGTRSDLVGPFSYGTDVWFRIRESGGTLFVDTAPSTASNPPISTDWVNARSSALDPGVAVTAGKIGIGAGSWASVASPTTFQFDGFNTAT